METRIDYLIRQYYYNRASQEELEEFLTMVRSARYDDAIAEVIAEIYAEIKRQDPSRTLVDMEGNLRDVGDLRQVDVPATARVAPFRRYRKWRWVAVAAVWLSVGVGSGYFVWKRTESSEDDRKNSIQAASDGFAGMQLPEGVPERVVETASAAPREITLSDGTRVWLNTSSRLEFPGVFDSAKRRIVHLVGEAYFEVEKSAEWPFVVHTDDVRTTVVGTKFNVKAYPGMADVEVAVRTGRVVVSRKDDVLATLGENQELKIPLLEDALVLRERSLTEKIAGNWTAGFLEYEDEAIEDILADLERVYQVRIILERPDLAFQHMTVSAKKEKGLKHMLDVICSLTNSVFDEPEDGVFTLRELKNELPM